MATLTAETIDCEESKVVLYAVESKSPLASMLVVAPMLMVYELGVLMLDQHAIRNGAEVLLRQFLDVVGFANYFLLPLMTVAILMGWHHTTRKPWRVRPSVLYGMMIESAFLALLLVVIAQLQGRIFSAMQAPTCAATKTEFTNVLFPRLVSFLGAGIYEELTFRLIMLPLFIMGICAMSVRPKAAILIAVVATSLIFSAAHYIPPHGDVFNWYTFAFRFSAGVWFAALFCLRGFGIAVGTHTLYDIFVGFIY